MTARRRRSVAPPREGGGGGRRLVAAAATAALLLSAAAAFSPSPARNFAAAAALRVPGGAATVSAGGGPARRRGRFVPSSSSPPSFSSTFPPRRPRSSTLVLRGGGSGPGSSSLSSGSKVGSGGGDEKLSAEGAVFMALLALQFGVQPALVKAYTPRGVIKSSVVLMQELTKFVISCVLYVGGTSKEKRDADFSGMTLWTWIAIAGVPAALYNVQNIASLLAYQNLEPLTFNVLNQTKTMSAALCCYLVMGKRQSKMQMASLLLLLVSALVIEKILTLAAFRPPFDLGGMFGWVSGLRGMFASGAAAAGAEAGGPALARHVTHGVLPILLASFISGLAGAIVQKNLQGASKSGKKKKLPRNPYLFNMELNSASALLLLFSMLFSADGRRVANAGFFDGWTPKTCIPILTNSVGGIIVALVTKYAGSVRKGFALIFGILISGVLQAEGAGGRLAAEQVVGGLLAAASLYLHTMYPYRPRGPKKEEEEAKAKAE